jgi:hypothetical protein
MAQFIQTLLKLMPSGRSAGASLGLLTFVGGGSMLAYNGLYNGNSVISIPNDYFKKRNIKILFILLLFFIIS